MKLMALAADHDGAAGQEQGVGDPRPDPHDARFVGVYLDGRRLCTAHPAQTSARTRDDQLRRRASTSLLGLTDPAAPALPTAPAQGGPAQPLTFSPRSTTTASHQRRHFSSRASR
ncbi:hypothetical protein [Nonomuraea sp. NPDC050786]|uniref:hypothetical protein n=1 Tax=Nonomuraea sp. NPDC050786 TaxID=3154840 RepID=UPI0033F9BD2B